MPRWRRQLQTRAGRAALAGVLPWGITDSYLSLCVSVEQLLPSLALGRQARTADFHYVGEEVRERSSTQLPSLLREAFFFLYE